MQGRCVSPALWLECLVVPICKNVNLRILVFSDAKMTPINKRQFLQLTGRSQEHLAYSEVFSCYLHSDVIQPLQQLRDRAAREAGIDLRVASGFRSFERQEAIWEAKVGGERPVMGKCGESALDVAKLTNSQLCGAILRWSALPGASRHHWGCDVDVYDQAAIGPSYRLQLSPQEYGEQGPFYRLSQWLKQVVAESDSPWFQPFESDIGGVGVEPWHISYAPLSQMFERHLNLAVLKRNIQQSKLSLKSELLLDADLIYQKYLSRAV